MTDPTIEGDRLKAGKTLTAGMFTLLLCINAVVSIISISIYDRYFAQKVAVVDIRGYLIDRKNMFLTGRITEKEFAESVDNIEKALRKTDKRTVVLMGDAVVRNAEKINIDN